MKTFERKPSAMPRLSNDALARDFLELTFVLENGMEMNLFTRFEGKLDEFHGNLERAVVELAKDWRTDRALRQLQAQMIVADADKSFLVSGNGDLLQPDGGLLAIGSGANYALAAATALLEHTALTARQVGEAAMKIAAEICIYTNDRFTVEELETR